MAPRVPCARSHAAALAFGIALTLSIPTSQAARPPAVKDGLPTRAASIIDNDNHMDVNSLDMIVTNHGSFAYDLTTGSPGLVYPKGSSRTVIFSGGLWLGARVLGETRVAVAEYAQEYVPGPMMSGTFMPDQDRFRNYRIDTGNTTDADYLEWPSGDGAPVDATGHPLLSGDATIWSVYNDADPSAHTNGSGSTLPLGIEVQQTTFAFNRSGPLDRTIFLKFKLTNKGAHTLDDAYVGLWLDPDLGGYVDDLSGCDVGRGLGYTYNATNADAQYGSSPPAVGLDLLRGPVSAADTLGMTTFIRYINGQDPSIAEETYNNLRGLHPDGTPIHEFDDPAQPATTFMFSGDPVAGTGWLDSPPADKRTLIASGPFRMLPGESQEIIAAILVGQGTDRLASIADLRAADDEVQSFFDSGFGLPPEPDDLPARVFVNRGNQTIRLRSGRPSWCVRVESADGAFQATDVDPASFVLRSEGTGVVSEISAIASKVVIASDSDGNGIAESYPCFASSDVARLFSSIRGRAVVPVDVSASLFNGSRLQGSMSVTVIGSSGAVAASVVPDESGGFRLEVFTREPGPLSVRVFDVQGRLRLTLVGDEWVPAGAHAYPLGSVRGARGIGFYQVKTPAGTATGRIPITR